MNDAPSDGSSTDTPLEPVRPGPRNRLRVAVALTLMAAVVVLAVLARVGLFGERNGQTASGPAAPSAVVVVPAPSDSSSPSDEPGVLVPEPSFEPQPPTSPGLIAVVDDGGQLWTMDDGGNFRVRYPGPGIVFGFPAWSPDGTKIAVVGQGLDDTGIYVFNVQPGGFEVPPMITASSGPDPVVIYRSADRPPFYLSWTPDGKAVGFLASEAVGISLRIAPADGSAPLDGSDPASIVRIGAPFYFDWLDAKRLLVHIDVGAAAFTGEVGLDGKSVRTALKGSGQFRSASHSRNGRYVAFVRSETDGSESLVVAARDGSSSHRIPVFGTAAFTFNPAGDTLAVIAAKESTTVTGRGDPVRAAPADQPRHRRRPNPARPARRGVLLVAGRQDDRGAHAEPARRRPGDRRDRRPSSPEASLLAPGRASRAWPRASPPASPSSTSRPAPSARSGSSRSASTSSTSCCPTSTSTP